MALSRNSLDNVLLGPSNTLLKSCPFGHILECQGIACVVPLLVDKIKVNLDFHIFDVLDLDLLLGFPVEKLLDASRGSLDEELREAASATTISCSGHPMVEPLHKQDPLEKMMHISPFASSEFLRIKGVDFLLFMSVTRMTHFTFVEANDHHHSRPSLSLFPLACIKLLSTFIEKQHRASTMNLLR